VEIGCVGKITLYRVRRRKRRREEWGDAWEMREVLPKAHINRDGKAPIFQAWPT
jgi:hypothetical protein